MESYEESFNPGVQEDHNLPFVLIPHHGEDVLKLVVHFLAHYEAGVIAVVLTSLYQVHPYHIDEEIYFFTSIQKDFFLAHCFPRV